MALLERYDYPGNVRELENAIEHAVTVATGPRIETEDLPAVLRAGRLLVPHDGATVRAGRDGVAPGDARGRVPSAEAPADRDSWSLADIEKEHIQRVLKIHRGNATTAARQLGISRTTLWRKLRGYGLTRREA